ncbi:MULTISPECIES: Stf0 family sulfotransferase [unclassified Sinorhizobium]|uniref:Stf0 family sulfotransferase n=1 Tax=unclassified Sinorhizobium TaxID=2613772 RepID=UPI0024C2AFF8|nr:MULTISPECIES: Stf0 family sulfotransferase [unclassified Sinorhizobium]MDK1373543.1 Stf0 family sulfotransferase [Sinorhizobium sp. 6-70]MDK1482144.1 Stf0 family sulfotransferase [Sinorhizobium sp. 6-117]
MRGYLLLTEARSGSNWLGSLINQSQDMGRSTEWLSPKLHGLDMGALSWDAFFAEVIRKCSTPNGVFGMKIFPNQLFVTRERYSRDFIRHCLCEHETAIVFLRRRDTLRQAISFARARQTRAFAAHHGAKAEPRYDFEQIARCFFYIRESYGFWQGYLDLLGVPFTEFAYEDLANDPSPFIAHIAGQLRVSPPATAETTMTVQRDDLTEEWIARFNEDCSSGDLLKAYDRREHIPGKMRNFAKLATGKLKPRYPFAF